MGKKLFDFIVGNPPYQEQTEKKSETNGQLRSKSIFPLFQEAADQLAEESSVLIYPGGRWIQRSGKGMANFGLKQINDPRLKELRFYPDCKEIFPSAAIADGISIVIKKMKKTENGFNYVYCNHGVEQKVVVDNPGENIMPLNPNDLLIVKKIEDFVRDNHIQYLHDRVLPQKLFGIESEFVEKNSKTVRELLPNSTIDYEKEIKLYTNDRAGKAGRTKWFITNRNTIPVNRHYIDKWKVVVSSANAGGQKRDNQLEIIDNHSAFGRSRVALAAFDTKQEAENFVKYVQSYVIRYAFLMTDEALTTVAMKVPDVGEYESNRIVDFKKDIDQQLFNLIGFTPEERAYIIAVVDEKRGYDNGKE